MEATSDRCIFEWFCNWHDINHSLPAWFPSVEQAELNHYVYYIGSICDSPAIWNMLNQYTELVYFAKGDKNLSTKQCALARKGEMMTLARQRDDVYDKYRTCTSQVRPATPCNVRMSKCWSKVDRKRKKVLLRRANFCVKALLLCYCRMLFVSVSQRDLGCSYCWYCKKKKKKSRFNSSS